MNNLVVLEKGKVPLTNSLIITENMGLSHHSIVRMIDKYIERLNRMGEVVRFQIDKPKGDKGGRPSRVAWLNKKQFLFLATMLRNSEKVLDFKEKLINEFERLQNMVAHLLTQRQNTEWLEIRQQGKLARRIETDTIQKFVEYCKAQGSTHSEKYYIHLSKMENKALFIVEQKYPNVRDILSGYQLNIIASADIAVSKALQEGMDSRLSYPKIYELAKNRIEKFAEIVGKQIVPVPLKSQEPEQLFIE